MTHPEPKRSGPASPTSSAEISPELVLVDPVLRRRALRELPDEPHAEHARADEAPPVALRSGSRRVRKARPVEPRSSPRVAPRSRSVLSHRLLHLPDATVRRRAIEASRNPTVRRRAIEAPRDRIRERSDEWDASPRHAGSITRDPRAKRAKPTPVVRTVVALTYLRGTAWQPHDQPQRAVPLVVAVFAVASLPGNPCPERRTTPSVSIGALRRSSRRRFRGRAFESPVPGSSSAAPSGSCPASISGPFGRATGRGLARGTAAPWFAPT